MSVAELKYQAILAVIGEGRAISEVAEQWRVSRRTLHRWLARYEAEGLEGLNERSHRAASCPHQATQLTGREGQAPDRDIERPEAGDRDQEEPEHL